LPAVFPFESSRRGSLGSDWGFDVSSNELTKGVRFSTFDPPIFDETDWKFSYPKESEDVREGAKVILRNHGAPILVTQQIGNGKVVWSGMNLAYHVIRFHNTDEVLFFKKILVSLLPEEDLTKPLYEASFLSSKKRKITTQGSRGILFKEQAYPGWKVKIKLNGKTHAGKIFKAGPAYPGFIYVRLPELVDKEVIVSFGYHGGITSWLLTILSLALIIFVLERTLLGGLLVGRRIKKLHIKTQKHVRGWWEKEEY